MTSREQFEAWASNQYPCEPVENILLRVGPDRARYHLKVIQGLWEAWQASRDAVEVELPAACADDEYFNDGVFQPMRYERDVERAIRAAGIKVKGE